MSNLNINSTRRETLNNIKSLVSILETDSMPDKDNFRMWTESIKQCIGDITYSSEKHIGAQYQVISDQLEQEGEEVLVDWQGKQFTPVGEPRERAP